MCEQPLSRRRELVSETVSQVIWLGLPLGRTWFNAAMAAFEMRRLFAALSRASSQTYASAVSTRFSTPNDNPPSLIEPAAMIRPALWMPLSQLRLPPSPSAPSSVLENCGTGLRSRPRTNRGRNVGVLLLGDSGDSVTIEASARQVRRRAWLVPEREQLPLVSELRRVWQPRQAGLHRPLESRECSHSV